MWAFIEKKDLKNSKCQISFILARCGRKCVVSQWGRWEAASTLGTETSFSKCCSPYSNKYEVTTEVDSFLQITHNYQRGSPSCSEQRSATAASLELLFRWKLAALRWKASTVHKNVFNMKIRSLFFCLSACCKHQSSNHRNQSILMKNCFNICWSSFGRFLPLKIWNLG